MKILFFDTETTGLVKDLATIENQPHVVQLGAIFGEYNEDGTIVSETAIDLLFNPGVPIPENCTAVHGITDEMVKEKPSFQAYAKEFVKLVQEADFVCGHNVDFDRKMIFLEIDRTWKKDSEEKRAWKKMFKEKEVCTMQKSIEFVAIPGRYGFKYPKLAELHQKLFGCDFDNAHNAAADIEATRKCFFEMKKIGLLTF